MTRPKFVTFDCYGTLVKFGLHDATRKVLGRLLDKVDAESFFREFHDLRYKEIFGTYRPYSEVLCRSLEQAMRQFGLEYESEYGNSIVAAVPTFGPYPEVPPALARIRERSKIVIISNSEDRLMAGNVKNIGVPFDRVITAEQARAYKPSLATFRYALRELGCQPSEILHVAAGFEYDIVPAHALGWARVWINRDGEAGDKAYGPYDELPDLSGLPDLIGV